MPGQKRETYTILVTFSFLLVGLVEIRLSQKCPKVIAFPLEIKLNVEISKMFMAPEQLIQIYKIIPNF